MVYASLKNHVIPDVKSVSMSAPLRLLQTNITGKITPLSTVLIVVFHSITQTLYIDITTTILRKENILVVVLVLVVEKVFTFESDLNYHRLKHRRNPGFMCNHEDNGSVCGKWFFPNPI